MNLRQSLPVLLPWLLLATATAPAADAAKIDPAKYEEVELTQLRATPEEYKNKRVRFATYFINYLTSFPEYMERSGCKPEKNYLIRVIPKTLPVIAKKDDEMNAIIPTLGRNKVVNVYGRIRNFAADPKGLGSEYYLDLEFVEMPDPQPELDIPEELIKEVAEWGLVVPVIERRGFRPIGPRRPLPRR